MSPLHLDYRPTELQDIVGNRDTVASIEAVLGRGKDYPHSWLFTGPRGCGKTTLARIVAARVGIADNDLRELNIGKLRGIDNAREIQDQMRLCPLSGGNRGWILDEVHMATKEFQNAMLKALEDTPGHVYFFLCTTDPQKLLKTVIDRCHRFFVESLGIKQLMELLNTVCDAEGVAVPNDVRRQIAEDADGSPRAALVVLDSIIDMNEKDMLAAAARKAEEQKEAIELCRALIKADKWMSIAKILKGMGDYDPETVRLAVLGYCQSILLKEDSARAWVVMDAFRDPFDRNGRPGVVWACYMAVKGD